MLKTWTINEMEKDMVEPHGEESRIEWLISCVRWKETAAHPMSWLAVTFTTQEINSLIRPLGGAVSESSFLTALKE